MNCSIYLKFYICYDVVKGDSMKTTWIIQTNMGQDSDIMAYVDAVKQSGADVIEVEYKAFSNELPHFDVDGPVVLYGAVNFIKEAYKIEKWRIGIFGHPDTFTYSAWAENYNEMLLNSPDGIQLMTLGDFTQDNRPIDDFIFVRPQHDTKTLVGKVWTAGEFKEWCIIATEGKYAGVDKDTPIVIAQPYGIEAEWRLFVVNNKVVGASQYHKKGRLFKSIGAPEDVLAFAEKVIDKWSPVPAYTLDICRSAGNCYIVEAQGFNSAGQYACNVVNVAKAVNEVAMSLWKNKIMKNKI